jgi:amidase
MDINGTPLAEASIASIQAAILTGQVSAEQVVVASLERIDQLDRHGPSLNAMVTMNARARVQAAHLDAAYRSTGRPVGPLHGVPMVIKDCLETVDMPTSFGSEVFAEYQPAENATAVAALRSAGAIILGKTTLPDWATSWFSYSSVSGISHNPYDISRDPGGSSSGTGAAVAAGYATAGLGTDCGGSIRLPSSFCNLVGVRSTPGLISRNGSNPLVGVQDTVGPMARSVQDAARVFGVLAGYDPADPLTYVYSVARAPGSYLDGLRPDALHGTRIGVLRSAFGSDDDPGSAAVNQVVAGALGELNAGGATLVDVAIDDLVGWITRTSMYTIRSRYDIDRFLETRTGAPMKSVEEIINSGRYHPKLDLLEALAAGPADPRDDLTYHAAYAARAEFTQLVVNLMARNELDALVYPTCQVVPPTHEETDSGVWNTLNFPTNTVIGSQTWMPAMSVPAGVTAAGLPVGMEVLARPYDEPTMFRIAYGFEQVTGHRVPPAACG